MKGFFPHEKLEVYAYALEFAKKGATLLDTRPRFVAVNRPLDRATESINSRQ